MVIWKTLLMRKALTNAVTKANPSRPLPKALMIWSSPALLSSMIFSRSTTSVRSGRTCCSAVATVAGSVPSATWMSMPSNWSIAPVTCWAVAMSHAASVAPAKPSLSPSPTSAVTVNGYVPVSVMTWIWSPTAMSSRSAVALSMATWSMPDGGVPSLICSPDSSSSPVQPTPSVGAPCVVTTSPSRIDDLGEALQQRLGGGDALDALDGRSAATPGSGRAAPARRRRRTPPPARTLQVDVLADLGEQVVERLAQAVGEHERADDEARRRRGWRSRWR